MGNIADLLAQGMRLQQSGQLAEAQGVYQQVLQTEPNNADALHLLGTLAIAGGRLPAAIEQIQRAIQSNPNNPMYHVNLGEAFRRSGDVAAAIACNERAIAVQPNMAGAHANLGQLQMQQGRGDAATESFRKLVELVPQDPRAHMLLAQSLVNQGRHSEAETHLRRAVALQPDEALTHFNLAAALHAQQRLDEAAASYRAAVERDPNNPAAQVNLGTVMQQLNQPDAAEAYYRRAIEFDPQLAGAYNNLGMLLMRSARFEEAVPVLRRAVELSPADAALHAALGAVLQDAGWFDEAEAASRRAIELSPRAAQAYNNLAICAQLQGRLDEAIELYQKAIDIEPSDPQNHSNRLYALNYHPGYGAQQIYDEHVTWGSKYADPLTEQSPPHDNDRVLDRRLKVGYVSPHFRSHAVNAFVEPILASHNHASYDVFCYSSTINPDDTTKRLQSHADTWRVCNDLSDEQLAERIREDQIDVLVDLSGHIGGNRLMLFARRPAPVQVTYVGYQNTTGMRAMDYRLTDDYADPPDQTDRFHTEQLVRLPRSFFCYLPSDDAPPVGPLPAVQRGHVTFGSFNNFAKITPQVLATWAELLRRVPDARLVILTTVTDSVRAYVHGAFAKQDVSSDRVELIHRRPRKGYLELISEVDVALDPFPFNGHTTTCDTLWQGVPVVHLSGDRYASRFGGSGLKTLGLEELIASTTEQYVDIASGLADDVDRLEALRATLRDRMQESPLADYAGFTRNLEAAYRQMWVDWCSKQSARGS